MSKFEELRALMLYILTSSAEKENNKKHALTYREYEGIVLFAIGCSEFSNMTIDVVTNCWLDSWALFVGTPAYLRNLELRGAEIARGL